MIKLKIILYDTNSVELEGHAKVCRAICEKINLPTTILTFSSGKSLVFEMGDPGYCDSVDILIIEPDGGNEALASYIRRHLGYKGLILYLSRSTDERYFYGAFDAGAYSYIKKGDLNRFSTVFAAALKAAEERERLFIAVSFNGEYKNIDIRDIHYFETSINHLICVKYKGGEFNFLSSLSSIEEQLKNRGFIRVQRSFLVSIDAIHKISFNEVILNNGVSIPVGRGNYSALKEAMDKWRGCGAAYSNKAI